MKRLLFALLCLIVSGVAVAQTENAWSSQDYDFYAGDFNGDGKTDILFVGRDPSLPSGILLSGNDGPTVLGQTWASDYLGIPWSSGTYSIVIGDFNGDGKSDILLQSNLPGDSYLLLTDSTGSVVGISQTIPAVAMGLGWSGDQHHLVAGDFTGSGRSALYLQPVDPSGTSAIVVPDANGQFTATDPIQTWSDGFLGLQWSTAEANVFAGDFNGDGYADLLVQAAPQVISGSSGTSFVYSANSYGVALGQPGGGQPFAAGGVQLWNHDGFGAEWSPYVNQLVIGDFTGDGRTDVFFQPLDSGSAGMLVQGNAPGPIFTSATVLPSDVPISAGDVVLMAGNFTGGPAAGLFLQSTSRNVSNALAKAIANGIHPTAITLPVLTSSLPVAPPPPASGPSGLQARAGMSALAATITPTSPGRTAAQFSVTPTGGASYNIPLWTPPGARGIEPHLALHYTSGGPDGPMGPGWSLTGLSAIARCGKTWASAGAPSGVTLATSDDICIDGNRLRITGGTQLITGSTYQTEMADFSNITAKGTTGSPATYFTVQGKDGRTYEYGATTDSRITASGASAPYMWALDKVSDRQGNTLAITYQTAATALTVTKITYTATVTNTTPPYEVDFSYVTRAGGSVISQFVAGSAVTRSTQLDNVTVLASTAIVRKYQLGYSASSSTNRPLLQTVQECGGSAGTDCIRPTTIAYTAGSPGWNTTATSLGVTIPTNAQVFPIDLNGDGFADMVYPTLSGTTYTWYVRYGSASGTFASAVALGMTTATTDAVFPADLMSRGHPDLIFPSGGYWTRRYWNGSAYASQSTGIAVVAKVAPSGAADVNGDGRPDLIFADKSDDSISNITVALNTSTGSTLSFAAPAIWYQFPMNVSCLDNNPCNEINVAGVPYTGTAAIQVADFNGDGLADVLVQANHHTKNGTTYLWDELVSTGHSFTLLSSEDASYYSLRPQLTDWNGDGCTDYLDPGITLGSTWTIVLSPCKAAPGTFIATTIPSSQPVVLLDYDGDGRIDLMTTNGTGNWQVARSTGTGISSFSDSGLPATSAFFVADFNGDGLSDLGLTDSSRALKVNLHLGTATPPDLASTFTDGFGIYFQPSYVPITLGHYTAAAGGSFPEAGFLGPMYVVSQFVASDGRGSTYSNDFQYTGARLHLQGRGFEGFASVSKHDSRDNTYQDTVYNQTFPTTGTVASQSLFEPDHQTLLASTQNSWTSVSGSGIGVVAGGTACVSCYFVYTTDQTTYNFEPSGGKAGTTTAAAVSNAHTHYTYDPFGNLTDTLVTTTDTDSGGSPATPSPFNGLAWTTEIQNSITNDATANWCIGRPYSTLTTKTAPGQTAKTRTVAHTIDYVACRATVETVEPGSARLKVTTTFGFDSCGNTNSVSVVGLDQNGTSMPARTTLTDYTSRCQLPETVTNALSQPTKTTYDYRFGLPATVTDPNNITVVSYLYDNFGRKTKETHADGTYTNVSYADCVSGTCWGIADLRFLVGTYNYTSDGAQHGSRNQYYDGLDRQRYDEAYRETGAWTNVVTNFDALGRKSSVYLPYSSGSNGYHAYSYDIASRVTEDDTYTSAAVKYRSVILSYAGQTTSVTDPNGHKITKVTDVAGKIRVVTDDASNAVAGTTQYTFDPFGNLITIQDADGISSSYQYNIRGFKTASLDADTGNQTFTPDSLNELLTQTDANGQTISFGYDLLGRMTSRLEPESSTATTWNYDSYGSTTKIGRLIHLSKPESSGAYTEDYTYDSVGRPSQVTYTEDGVGYVFNYAYNTWGKVDTLTYPTSTSGYRFALKNVYDSWGFLSQVKDNATGNSFWTLNSSNDSSLPTSEALGNGITAYSAYTPHTNEITSRSEGTGTQTNNIQSLAYQWDLAGNLHTRQDLIQTLTEQFSYDSMNRLLNSTLNGATNLTATYSAAGNIATKSDVSASAYVYDASHRHAVKTAGSWSMTYDANGNMITRAGGTLTWMSYNLPNTISFGSNSTQFWYNANHQRWKQAANYAGTIETTHYIGGLLEVMTRGSGPTEYRHQIPAGSNGAIYTRRSDSTTATYYATSDHLGSSDLVLDSVGNVLVRQSFTPFGARRASSWSNTAPPSADYTVFGNTTRKGFTGHEMLDSVGLVHMGGRVYDPYLGRFTSPDTLIQSLGASQSINPFAYAWNDPLRYTDPTGHSLLGAIVGIIAAIAAVAICNAALIAYYGAASVAGLTAASAGALGGFVGGFVGAMVSTGSLSASLTAGLIGGATGWAMAEVGNGISGFHFGSEWEMHVNAVVAHSAVGCVSTMLSGGNCGRGALAAGLSEAAVQAKWVDPPPQSFASWGTFKGAVEAGMVGGAASSITGGKFQDGFSVSAAGYLFNDAEHAGAAKVYGKVDSFIEGVAKGEYSDEQKIALLASAIKQDRAIQAWIAGDDNRFGNSLLQELDARTEQDISRLTNAVMPYIVGKVGELGAAHYFLLATSAAGDIGEMASESLEAAHLWSNIGLFHAPSMVSVVPGVPPASNTYTVITGASWFH
jgi:RHS repeat-associated protein